MQKFNARKYMRNINNNAVQGCLSENYLTQKKLSHEILAIYGTAWVVLYGVQ